ncbi:hypothetical protein TWF718_009737 [Orbilia javanica]|uniref:Uncharacterized protein n=1 Tax=Orbilia javanica TaxID=47235 RepID=A0AAN8MKM9_9PEZI
MMVPGAEDGELRAWKTGHDMAQDFARHSYDVLVKRLSDCIKFVQNTYWSRLENGENLDRDSFMKETFQARSSAQKCTERIGQALRDSHTAVSEELVEKCMEGFSESENVDSVQVDWMRRVAKIIEETGLCEREKTGEIFSTGDDA